MKKIGIKLICLIAAVMAMMSWTSVYAAGITVSALMYHDVVETEEELGDYSVLTWQIESDIQLLLANGFTFITPSELLNIDPNTETRKLIMLTVDDGYESFYKYIYPLCQKYGIKANINMIVSKIGTENALTAEQLREMSDSGLVEVGNHTYFLHRRPAEELWGIYHDPSMYEDIIYDISLADKILQEIIGKKVVTLAYPNGISSTEVNAMVKEQLKYGITFSTYFDTIYFNGDTSAPFNRMNRDYMQSSDDVLRLINERL